MDGVTSWRVCRLPFQRCLHPSEQRGPSLRLKSAHAPPALFGDRLEARNDGVPVSTDPAGRRPLSMRTISRRRGSLSVLVAGFPLLLGACSAHMAEGQGTRSGSSLVQAGVLGSAPLIDTVGQAWQPNVERPYVSASGLDCAAISLTPLAGGLPIHRAVCIENGRVFVAVPLTLMPGEADPRFAPLAVPTSPVSEPPSTNLAPFSQRSPS